MMSEDCLKKRQTLLRKGTALFWEIVESGVQELERRYEGEDTPKLMDQRIVCLRYMTNRDNFLNIVKEWACLARLRVDRNMCSHAFDPNAHEDLQQAALTFYEDTLSDAFAEDFRNVGLLGLLNLKAKVARFPPELENMTNRIRDDIEALDISNVSDDDCCTQDEVQALDIND